MADNELTEMPWSGIAMRALQVAGVAASVVFLGLAGVAKSELRRQEHEKADSQRVRWTDKNRWE